ncbi:hypothetical protein GOP47_0029538 [Adiantum capillus-veneris]|nr:hypothetical protein GOP47_0029538 [Adiantum capillus-veneris]
MQCAFNLGNGLKVPCGAWTWTWTWLNSAYSDLADEEASEEAMPLFYCFPPLLLPLLQLLLIISSLSRHVYGTPIVWHLNQSFSIQASSPAFPLPQPSSLIFPFYPEVQQISNSSDALNASVFACPCFFQPSTSTSDLSPSSLSSTIFALCMTGVAPYQGSNSSLDGYPAIIWRANRLSPAHGETVSLALQEDGDLVLRGFSDDGVKMVAWRSNTSGMGVTRMQLSQQPPNLILYDADNVTVWQSSDYPPDTLTYGQTLSEGMKLVSYGSSGSEYNLEINTTSYQLTLFFKKHALSQAIPYWIWQFNDSRYVFPRPSGGSCGPHVFTCNAPMSPSKAKFAAFINSEGFSLGDPSDGGDYTAIQGLTYSLLQQDLQSTILQLDVYGSLRLLSIKRTWSLLADLFSAEDACSLPQICGTYGVCVGASKQCKCPNPDPVLSTSTASPQVSSFIPSDPNDPSKGCTLASPLPACTNYTTAVTNAEYNSSAGDQQVQMQLVEGMDYFSTLQGSVNVIANVSSDDNCSTLCLHSCSCVAAFWRAELHRCSHIAEQQLGSFRGGMNSTIYKAFLKVTTLPSPVVPPAGVAPSPTPLGNARKVAVGVGVSIATFFIMSILLFFLWRHKHRNRSGKFDAFVSVNDGVLGNTAMLKLPPRYSYNELHAATKGFSHLLGKGGFGSVYAGVLADGTTKVAVKKLEGMKQGEKEFKTELAIMGGIHHYNLLQLMGYCAEGSDQRLLVYKYMENGSLDQWLFASSSARVSSFSNDEAGEQSMTRLKWGVRYAIAVDVAKGLAYLHEGCEKRIIHLDIKPQNILLDDGFVAKVADFGLSRGMEREESHVVTTMRGTPGYLAPEWMRDGTIDVKCDVFSFGMLLMEIVSGRKNVDTSRSEAPFYPEWAYSLLVSDKLGEGNGLSKAMVSNTKHGSNIVEDLTDAKLENEQDRSQVLRLITSAFLCVLERPEWRPSMSLVVQMLEGQIPLANIDLLSLHQGLLFVLGSHNSSSSGSPGYNSQAVALRREFQEQLESILALSRSSCPATSFTGEECSQVIFHLTKSQPNWWYAIEVALRSARMFEGYNLSITLASMEEIEEKNKQQATNVVPDESETTSKRGMYAEDLLDET